MQITRVEVISVELPLQQAVQIAQLPAVGCITAVFIRFETREGRDAWGCTIAHPNLTGDTPEDLIQAYTKLPK